MDIPAFLISVVSVVVIGASPAPDHTGSCKDAVIVDRVVWHAVEARHSYTLQSIPVQYIFIHHTQTPECHTFQQCAARVRSLQHHDMYSLGWTDIGYNFLIGGDGYVYEGRGWYRVAAKNPGYNAKSISIGLIGNFQNKMPTAIQLQAAKNLIDCARTRYTALFDPAFKLGAHRDLSDTLCPGEQLYNVMKHWENFSNEFP